MLCTNESTINDFWTENWKAARFFLKNGNADDYLTQKFKLCHTLHYWRYKSKYIFNLFNNKGFKFIVCEKNGKVFSGDTFSSFEFISQHFVKCLRACFKSQLHSRTIPVWTSLQQKPVQRLGLIFVHSFGISQHNIMIDKQRLAYTSFSN